MGDAVLALGLMYAFSEPGFDPYHHDGGTVRLPHIVGLGRALDLILTGRPVGAEEALAMGFANP